MSGYNEIDFRPTRQFLSELTENNDKTWFAKNRDRYEEHVLGKSKVFVEAVAPQIAALDPELKAEPKVNGSLFRMHRDLRFSKDKRPYKEEVGFRFYVDSTKSGKSTVYMRVQPDSAGVAAGIWQFGKAEREAWREAVSSGAGEALARVLDELEAEGFHISADTLKRVPKPWDDEHPRADLLRFKGLVVGYEEEGVDVGPGFADWCVAHWKQLQPVHAWLRTHLG